MGWPNRATISAAVVAQLKANLPATTDAGLPYRADRITRAEYMNKDPGATPWIGVYRAELVLDPERASGGTPWTGDVAVRVIVQAVSRASGAEAETLLEESLADVSVALESDRTLGGTVDQVVGYRFEDAFFETEEESLHFLATTVTILARKKI